MSHSPSLSRFVKGFVAGVVLALIGTSVAAAAPKTGKLKFEITKLSDNLNEGIAVFDVNHDGKLDITAGPTWYEGPSWKPRPVRDLSAILNDEYLDTNGEHAIDLNGDGWVDLISGSWFSDKIAWFENPGKDGLAGGKLWERHPVIDGQDTCEATLLEDIDGDGTPELIINRWEAKKPLTIIRIQPGKDGGAPKFEPIQIAEQGHGHGVAVGDLNGDKRADIVVPGGWFEQPASDWSAGGWKFHTGIDIHHACAPGVVTDLNGDGKNDVIMGLAHNYGVWWFEQGPVEDGEITWIEHEIDKSFSQAHVLVWEDLDGDGQRELITGKRYRGHKGADPGANEPVCLFRYVWDAKKGAFEKDVISFDQGVGTGMQIRVVDVNGDKKPDIAVAGKSGTYVLMNRGPAGD